MNFFIAVASWLMLTSPVDSYFIVDRNFKKPVELAADFTLERYLQGRFPIYSPEAQALIGEIDKAVKSLDDDSCGRMQEWRTAHSTLFVEERCDDLKIINITLTTKVEELSMSFSFALARNETNRKKAQRILLDFAAYLNR